MKEKTKNLYPVNYNGKDYYYKDCADIFTALYNDIVSLTAAKSVYLGEGMYVYPCGKIEGA